MCLRFKGLQKSLSCRPHKSRDDVTFNSEPEGARILSDGVERGQTPATIGVSCSAFTESDKRCPATQRRPQRQG